MTKIKLVGKAWKVFFLINALALYAPKATIADLPDLREEVK
jgi:hypothetical protein